jgi:phosphoribosylformylglycinamidine (FGAM) synthase-like amidotransferase family enzyme
MQTQIKFLVGGANSVCGGFVAGDILRCSTAFAKHLVEDVKCAKYMDAAKEPTPVVTTKRRKAKE